MDLTTKVSNFCEAIEDVTDELTHTAGAVTTKIAPLMATFASGLSVLFAVYDGIGALLEARIPEWAYWISAGIGVLVMLGLEGASLAAVFNLDRTRALNAARPDDQQVDEGSLPAWMLVLTMFIVFCTEVAPTTARWVNGLVSTSNLVFAFGLLALPLLGRAGAVIFSNSRTLDGLDGADDKRQSKKEKRRLADLDLEIKREEAKQRLAQQQAEHAQKLELQRMKSVNRAVNGVVNTPPETPGNTPVDTVNTGEIDTQKLLEFYRENPASSLRKTGTAFGVSHTQISKVLKRLEGEGLVSVNGVVKVH